MVTNLPSSPKRVYVIYTDRGDPENRIKELKNDLAMDRTNCSRFLANRFRVLLTAAAYVLMQKLRLQARHTDYARAQVSTLRLRLLKLAAWILVSVPRIVLHLPPHFPRREAWLRIAPRLGCVSLILAEKDVQTTSFNVHPIHKQDQRGRTQPAIVAYRVVNQVKVEVRNLPQLGEALDALVRAGSNRISGVSFGVDDSTGVLDQARNRAIDDARRRANLYALAAGVKVGKLLRISEQPVQIPEPRRLDYARAAGAEASRVPVATGEQELRATVHVVFALEDAD